MRTIFLTVILAATLLFFYPGGQASAAYPAPTGTSIAGDRQVYMAWYDGNWEIFMHDIASGEITRITDEPHIQGYPDIWDHYIVWQDNRDQLFLKEMITECRKVLILRKPSIMCSVII